MIHFPLIKPGWDSYCQNHKHICGGLCWTLETLFSRFLIHINQLNHLSWLCGRIKDQIFTLESGVNVVKTTDNGSSSLRLKCHIAWLTDQVLSCLTSPCPHRYPVRRLRCHKIYFCPVLHSLFTKVLCWCQDSQNAKVSLAAPNGSQTIDGPTWTFSVFL